MDLKELWIVDPKPVVEVVLVDPLAMALVLNGFETGVFVVSSCDRRWFCVLV